MQIQSSCVKMLNYKELYNAININISNLIIHLIKSFTNKTITSFIKYLATTNK